MNMSPMDVCPFPPSDCSLLATCCCHCLHLQACILEYENLPSLFDGVQRTPTSGLLVPTQTSNDFKLTPLSQLCPGMRWMDNCRGCERPPLAGTVCDAWSYHIDIERSIAPNFCCQYPELVHCNPECDLFPACPFSDSRPF
jgi:hypothetical protein